MTARLGRRSGVLAALVAAIAVLVPTSPALAAAQITIERPGDGQVLDSSSVPVRGTVAADPLFELGEITLTINGATTTRPCSGSSCSFSWDASKDANGPYTLVVSTSQRLIGGVVGDPVPSTQSRKFNVGAPPQRPTLDPPRVTDGRTVELSWSRNSEPDMIRYAISRKAPGASSFSPLTVVPQPPPGSKVTYTDTSTSVFGGGDFAYQVVAIRRGPSGTESDAKSSAASAPATAGVPAPPPPTTAVPPPGSPGATGGSTTTVKPGQAGGVDLPGFLSSRSQPAALPPISPPELPDNGFGNTLPFGARPPGDDVEEGGAEAVAPRNRSSSSAVSAGGATRPLVPVAAGLLLMVLAMHLRLLNRRVKPVSDGDLPVDLHRPADPPSPARPPSVRPVAAVPAPQPIPEPEPEPHSRFYDALEEPDWFPEPAVEPEAPEQFWAAVEPEEPEDGQRWAPGAAEAEAEPEPQWETESAYAIDPEPADDLDLDPDAEPDPEPEGRWAPPAEAMVEPEPEPDPDEIEVFDVVSPHRRHLARSGSR